MFALLVIHIDVCWNVGNTILWCAFQDFPLKEIIIIIIQLFKWRLEPLLSTDDGFKSFFKKWKNCVLIKCLNYESSRKYCVYWVQISGLGLGFHWLTRTRRSKWRMFYFLFRW